LPGVFVVDGWSDTDGCADVTAEDDDELCAIGAIDANEEDPGPTNELEGPAPISELDTLGAALSVEPPTVANKLVCAPLVKPYSLLSADELKRQTNGAKTNRREGRTALEGCCSARSGTSNAVERPRPCSLTNRWAYRTCWRCELLVSRVSRRLTPVVTYEAG